MKVAIFEREVFPRDHVGESQLPLIGKLLDELGVWDAVEAAEFPIKIGATYRWGKSNDLWDFHFVPNGDFHDEPRPAKYEGQRTDTALQVDRAVYDKILAEHAESLGCDVRFDCPVRSVERDGDRVTGLILADGTRVEADTYIDASGHSGILRRAMGVEIEEPSKLRNVAFWDYWQNADWAVSVGVGGTRVQVMSVGYGWLWFIPLSPTRTSIGLVCPADYYKQSGRPPEELYREAMEQEPRIRSLVVNATSEGKFSTTKDWSFVAERITGENWYLVGEALGFADPILAAGLTITHASARECAFSIIESRQQPRSLQKDRWLKEQYEQKNRRRLLQHIRFADYWYSANAHFTELKEFTREIARDAGLELDADRAFQWLGTGGFVEEDMGTGGFGTVALVALHQITRRFSENPAKVEIDGSNMYVLRLRGANQVQIASYSKGRVHALPALERDGKLLPLYGMFGYVVEALQQNSQTDKVMHYLFRRLQETGNSFGEAAEIHIFGCLEAMARDGWISCKRSDLLPPAEFEVPENTPAIMANQDPLPG
ncbi:putative halogenase [Fimbriimonas ginsengisoli Gsoil 348]|uniref:Putative halogenase n=1 Tax=Fimbriimonas ginsengisoli Gsoil 348 TaxID=661478 RepID=A0A068NS98_FIMGI|nr:putative halogenase [Fimbriimonas ginsengisoli Gsoil 348]